MAEGSKQDNTPDRVFDLYRRATKAIMDRKGATALGHLSKAVREVEASGRSLDQNFYMTMLFSWADLFWSIQRPDLVLEVFDLFETQTPGDPHISLQRAIALFHLARFDDAQRILSELEDRGYPAADMFFFLGCLAERVSREATAMSHFQRAAMLEPERYTMPGKSDAKTLKHAIKKVIKNADESLRASLSHARVIVEPFPSDKLLSDSQPKLDPLALTMVDLDTKGASASTPAIRSIRLFLHNIEKVALSDEEIEERLSESLAHELSAVLESDEDSMRKLVRSKH